MEWIWELNETERVGVNSGQAHMYLQSTPESKSRASVIFFLNDLVEEGVLSYEERTGKGGHHRVYYPKMTREEYSNYVVETIIRKLRESFPLAETISRTV
ncbi:MAG: BlaI/MecI/CopY family transcriptional regulator [Candidatus Bathyarchaeota archaeon]